MGKTISAAMPAAPPTTCIQDPAARKWAAVVSDSLRAVQSDEFAVRQLARAAAVMSSGGSGAPPEIAKWLFSSRLYATLSSAIERVDVDAKKAILEEARSRSQALYEEQVARADGLMHEAALRTEADSAEIAARTNAINTERTERIAALSAEAAARGTAISNEASLRISADSAMAQQIQTLTASTNSGMAAIQDTLTTLSGADAALAQRVSVLAASTDVVRSSVAAMVVQEARARSESDSSFAQQISTISAAVAGNSAAIQSESQVRSSQYGSLAEQVALISAGVGEQFDFFKIWYFDNGTDGWTGVASPTASAGWIKPGNQAGASPIDSPSGLSVSSSTYSQVKARIRKNGAPTWAGALWWKNTGDSTWDAARSIPLPEPAYDASGIGVIDVSVGWVGSVDQVRVVFSTSQSDSSGFLMDWFAIGRPSPGASAAALQDERSARASADVAIASDVSALSASVAGGFGALNAAIANEAATRASADSAAASQISVISATANSRNRTFRQPSEPAASAEGDVWFDSDDGNKAYRSNGSSWVPTDDARIAQNAAAITAEQSARASADTALTQQVSALSATVTGNDSAVRGLITAEQSARASADTAITQQVNTLSATVSGNSAAITSEAGTRASNDLTLVQAINTMWAMTGANQAVQQSGSNLLANWTASQANYWNTLNAEVFTSGGQTIRAALAQEASARATLAGQVQATWTVRVDANGYVAGIGLGVEGGPGGATSSFIIRADKFAMVMPGYGEYVPFAIGPTGVSFSGATSWAGVTGSGRPADNATVGAVIGQNLGGTFTAQNIAAYMPAAVIGQAQIQEAAIGRAQIQASAIGYANIGDAEIRTLKIAGEAVVVPRSAYTGAGIQHPRFGNGNSAGWQVVQSCYMDAGGAPVSVVATVSVKNYAVGDIILVAPSGVWLAAAALPAPFGVSGPYNNLQGPASAVTICATSSEVGVYTVQIAAKAASTYVVNGTYYATVETSNRSLILLGTKR